MPLWVIQNVIDACPDVVTYFVEQASTAREALKVVCEREDLEPTDRNSEGYGASVLGYVAVFHETQDEGEYYEWGKPVVGDY